MPTYKQQQTAQANTANNMSLTVAPAVDAEIQPTKKLIVAMIKNNVITMLIKNEIIFAIYSKFYAEKSAVNILF